MRTMQEKLTSLLASMVLCLFAGLVHADKNTTKKFDIPAQGAAAALNEFARQADITLVFSYKLVSETKTKAIKGEFSVAEALKLLLQGTPLSYEQVSDRTIAINTPKGARITLSTLPLAIAMNAAAVDIDGAHVAAADSASGESAGDKKNAAGNVEEMIVEETKIKPYSDANTDIPRTINDQQPYYIFDSKTIERSGALNIEDFLKQRLTMNTSFRTASQGYGIGGIASQGNTSLIDLRGLGRTKTLILVNGRRMAGINGGTNTGTDHQPDLNGIPLSAIDRIEVLPTSASGIYGGNAMGGVINVILKRDYSGGDLGISYESTWDGHGPIKGLDASYGKAFEGGKTRLMLSGRYTDSEPMQVKDRLELYYRGYNRILTNAPEYLNTGLANRSAPFGATPNIIGLNANYQITNLTLKNGGSLNSPMATLPVGYSAASNPSTIIGGQWNTGLAMSNNWPSGLEINLGNFPKNLSFTATASRQMTDRLELFVEATRSKNESISKANPMDSFLTVMPDSPVSPFNEMAWVWLPLHLSLPATVDSVSQTFTVGAIGKLPFDWVGELDYTNAKNSFKYRHYAFFSFMAEQAIARGDLNPFVDSIASPPDMSPYLALNTGDYGSYLKELTLRASGPLVQLPWGAPTLTVGLEHRKQGYPQGIRYQPYPAPYEQNSNQAITLAQSQNTDSIYAELKMPLITEAHAMPLLRSVELQVAGRSERYDVNAGTTSVDVKPLMNPPTYSYSPRLPNGQPYPASRATYRADSKTVGIKYQPVAEITFRTSVADAFLPPSYNQLLPNPVPSNPSGTVINDPVTRTSYSGYRTLSGGNPNLAPMSSKSWNAGLIYEPQQQLLKGARLNIEHYRINQYGYITSLTAQQTINSNDLAERITRDPLTNLITLIDLSLTNVTEFKTAGWDFSLGYTKATPIGTFDFNVMRTIIDYEKRQFSLTSAVVDYAGYPASGGPNKAKSNTTLAWEHKDWSLAWATTWFGSYKSSGASGGPNGAGNAAALKALGTATIKSQMYHDLVVSRVFGRNVSNELYSNLTVQIGIKNVFNTLPPMDLSTQPFYYSPYGSVRLRDYWLSVKKRF